MEVELKHTWRVRRSAWYIRLYLWVWGGDVEDITFCKIWWAYVFMWFGLPLKCLLLGLSALGRAFMWGLGVTVDGAFALGRGIKMFGRGVKWLLVKVIHGVDRVYTLIFGPPAEWLALSESNADDQERRSRRRLGRPIVWARGRFASTGASQVAISPPFQKPKPVTPIEPDSPLLDAPRIPIMMRILNGITLGAAWVGMHRHRVAPIVTLPFAVGLTTLWAGLKLLARGGWLLIKGIAFIGQCVGLLGFGLAWIVYAGIAQVVKVLYAGIVWSAKKSWPAIHTCLILLAFPFLFVWVCLQVTMPVVADVIEAMLMGLGWGVAKAARLLWTPIAWAARPLTKLENAAFIVAIVLTAGYMVGCLGLCIVLFIINISQMHLQWWYPLAGIGGMVGAISVGLLLGWLLTMFLDRVMLNWFIRPTKTVVSYGAAKSIDGITYTTVGFGKIMLIGLKSVKANTCPKVEVEE